MRLTRKALTLLSIFIILTLLLTACGGSDATTPTTSSGSGDQTVKSAESSQQHAPESGPQEEAKTSDQQEENDQTATSQAVEKTENAEEKSNLVKGKVTKTVDGDTVYIKLDSGKEEKVRLIGVDTPESTTQVEPYGKEAAAYTKSKLLGKDVWLELDVQERDKYGRLLAYVWLSRPTSENDEEIRTKMFNAVLLLEGYAQVMTVPPNVKYVDYFKKYQQEAREKNAGLWGLEVEEEKQEVKEEKSSSAVQASSQPATASYIGNKNTKKFHHPDCQWAEKIAPGNRISFKSRDEAIKAGYVPCKVCRP